MTIINPLQHPAALLEELPDEVADAIAELFPTTRRITADDTLHEQDWDVLVTAASRLQRAPHLNVVAFGTNLLDMPFDETSSIAVAPSLPALAKFMDGAVLGLTGSSLAAELVIPANIGGTLGALVRTDLAPACEQLPTKTVLRVYSTLRDLSLPPDIGLAALVRPFLLVGGKSVLAGSYTRSRRSGKGGQESAGGELWFLPASVTQHAAWVGEALRQWHEQQPERFPGVPDWWSSGIWGTSEQVAARKELSMSSRPNVPPVSLSSHDVR